jgi:hypothetical protein
MWIFSTLTFFSLIQTVNVSKNELSPTIGFYNGDALRSTTLGGASYTYHYNSSFWMGVDFQGGKVSVDEPNGLFLQAGQKFIALDGTLSWNIPSILGASKGENAGYASDLYTSIGGGNLWIAKNRRPFGIIGGGLLIHFPIQYLAVRFDLKGLFYTLSNSQGSDMNFDSILSLGPSFLF